MPRRPLILIAALVCAASLAGAPPALAVVGDCNQDPSWPANRADLATQVVALVNAHRVGMGLTPLVVSPTLSAAATWKARHMANYRYMDHDDPAPPVDRTAGERFVACGYPTATWGENIAEGYSSAQAVVDGWLNSPGHRANIENPAFRATGVGAAGSPLYWAQTFGSAIDAGSITPPPVAPAPAPAPPAAAPPASTTPAPTFAASAVRPLKVSCAQHGRRVACRVRGERGAMVRIALRRGGRTYARTQSRARSDLMRVTLHPMRRLRAGRYDVVARAASSAGSRERRMSLVVR